MFENKESGGKSKEKKKTMELSLDSSLVFIPATISEFIAEISTITDISEKLSKLDDYVKRLEEEKKKIDAFKRELPLCMLLLNDAIGRLKEEATKCKELKNGPVIEEFIPLKGNSDENGRVNSGDDFSDKRNWMSSAQLWSTNIDSDYKKRDHSVSDLKLRNEEDDRSVPENPIELCNYGNRGGGFVPFKGKSGCGLPRSGTEEDKEVSDRVPSLSLMPPMAAELGGSLSSNSNSNSKTNHGCRGGPASSLLTDQMKVPSKPQQQTQHQQAFRKQRRCWSPELHRRFIDALQQLGGSQAATPKQIRELMQVEGLTNDEVKSHLQKYRLHVRKLPAGQGGNLWMAQEHSLDNSKANISQSGSPQGPLLAGGSAKGLSSTGCDSMEAEEDEKSDGHSWKSGLHRAEQGVV